MKYFLQDNIGQQVDAIVKKFNKLMDGDVSGQMKKKGIEYKVNYGSSVVWLKKLAEEYVADNELAERLWLREIRETMILATLIAKPDKDFLPVLNKWMMNLVSDEMAEQVGVNLLWKMEDIDEFCCNLLKVENERCRAAVWIGLSVCIQKGVKFNEFQIRNFLDTLSGDDFYSMLTLRAKGRFLRQICRNDKKWISDVEEVLKKIEFKPEYCWLVEDVKTEMAFLKEL